MKITDSRTGKELSVQDAVHAAIDRAPCFGGGQIEQLREIVNEHTRLIAILFSILSQENPRQKVELTQEVLGYSFNVQDD